MLVRIIGTLLAVLAVSCGGSSADVIEFHSLSIDDAALTLRLGSVSVSSEHTSEFHRQYGNARQVTSTAGFVAIDDPGHVLQRGDTAGGVNRTATASTGTTNLSWDRAPFSGIDVRSDISVGATEPAEYAAITVVPRDSCFTLTTWDLWELNPAPAQMLGPIEISEPTTAILVTTVVIESSICQ